MAGFTKYTTKQGDRWDLIAFNAYGDASRFNDIMAANPGVAASAVLDAGIELLIPIMEEEIQQSTSMLPPWKR